jgi:hypothetical protein
MPGRFGRLATALEKATARLLLSPSLLLPDVNDNNDASSIHPCRLVSICPNGQETQSRSHESTNETVRAGKSKNEHLFLGNKCSQLVPHFSPYSLSIFSCC